MSGPHFGKQIDRRAINARTGKHDCIRRARVRSNSGRGEILRRDDVEA